MPCSYRPSAGRPRSISDPLPAITDTLNHFGAGRDSADGCLGYDDPVNIEGDLEEVLSELLDDEASPGAADKVEPELDD